MGAIPNLVRLSIEAQRIFVANRYLISELPFMIVFQSDEKEAKLVEDYAEYIAD